ncbi:MAG: YcaO-like family protein [Deltaproteobacteria bacterium]|nr:YcaO-like family protein [Deltaproteobacteria bacterium]
MGITRLADVTGLDRLGIPTFCAIRPGARLVQVANGKGLVDADARVSALMEAIEVFHAEEPTLPVVTSSFAALCAAGQAVAKPQALPGFVTGHHYNDDYVVDWVPAEELHSGARVLVPASAAYPVSPSLYLWWTNGLASGNHLVEATLHALYEIIERHAMATAVLPDPDPLALLRPRVSYLRLATITSAPVAELCERIARHDLKLLLATVKSAVPVHTFWAILLDKKPQALTTLVNTGYGTHASPTVAAIRAITEAAQSRLAMIHASREDVAHKPAFTDHDKLSRGYAFFDNIIGGGDWRFLCDYSRASLRDDYERLVAALATCGAGQILRVDLTRAPFNIPVVKVIVPGFRFDDRLV